MTNIERTHGQPIEPQKLETTPAHREEDLRAEEPVVIGREWDADDVGDGFKKTYEPEPENNERPVDQPVDEQSEPSYIRYNKETRHYESSVHDENGNITSWDEAQPLDGTQQPVEEQLDQPVEPQNATQPEPQNATQPEPQPEEVRDGAEEEAKNQQPQHETELYNSDGTPKFPFDPQENPTMQKLNKGINDDADKISKLITSGASEKEIKEAHTQLHTKKTLVDNIFAAWKGEEPPSEEVNKGKVPDIAKEPAAEEPAENQPNVYSEYNKKYEEITQKYQKEAEEKGLTGDEAKEYVRSHRQQEMPRLGDMMATDKADKTDKSDDKTDKPPVTTPVTTPTDDKKVDDKKAGGTPPTTPTEPNKPDGAKPTETGKPPVTPPTETGKPDPTKPNKPDGAKPDDKAKDKGALSITKDTPQDDIDKKLVEGGVIKIGSKEYNIVPFDKKVKTYTDQRMDENQAKMLARRVTMQEREFLASELTGNKNVKLDPMKPEIDPYKPETTPSAALQRKSEVAGAQETTPKKPGDNTDKPVVAGATANVKVPTSEELRDGVHIEAKDVNGNPVSYDWPSRAARTKDAEKILEQAKAEAKAQGKELNMTVEDVLNNQEVNMQNTLKLLEQGVFKIVNGQIREDAFHRDNPQARNFDAHVEILMAELGTSADKNQIRTHVDEEALKIFYGNAHAQTSLKQGNGKQYAETLKDKLIIPKLNEAKKDLEDIKRTKGENSPEYDQQLLKTKVIQRIADYNQQLVGQDIRRNWGIAKKLASIGGSIVGGPVGFAFSTGVQFF